MGRAKKPCVHCGVELQVKGLQGWAPADGLYHPCSPGKMHKVSNKLTSTSGRTVPKSWKEKKS